MDTELSERFLKFAEENREYHLELTRRLARVPAPSNHEDKRARWVKEYLESLGGECYIDSHMNVVLPLGCDGCDEITVFMAHTDVVFPDTEELPLTEDREKIFCPGICDDTRNLTGLLMIAKYILENGIKPKKGVLLVANSGEEGLGNLRGSMGIMDDFRGRIEQLVSFDGNFGAVVNDAVGSHRYSVKIATEGGHSYMNFGNRNAIAYMSSLINDLYKVQVPPAGRTTYNVGTISGGTSVNSIAQDCEMLYEYRSDSRDSLATMEKTFRDICRAHRPLVKELTVQVLGKRPCAEPVDREKMERLCRRAKEIGEKYTGKKYYFGAASTDCNSPLSRGVPAVCFGICQGKGAHTRQEELVKSSLPTGLKIAGAFMAPWFENF